MDWGHQFSKILTLTNRKQDSIVVVYSQKVDKTVRYIDSPLTCTKCHGYSVCKEKLAMYFEISLLRKD